uniref:Uncharacterized protein n=1 Tax=Saccharolobus solfataricus (strain 98/2) TaxID=555311 RepID=D0KRI9_SACS9
MKRTERREKKTGFLTQLAIGKQINIYADGYSKMQQRNEKKKETR